MTSPPRARIRLTLPPHLLIDAVTVRRLTIGFFAASLIVYYLIAVFPFDACTRRFRYREPTAWSGDEPHYLVMINSLLKDRDLNLGNNYESSRYGGLDAGVHHRESNVDHHTVIIDRRTRESALWNSVFNFHTEPCPENDLSCVGHPRLTERFPDYTPASTNFLERPWHPIPFPATVALLIAGTAEHSFEADSIYVVIFLSWLAGLLTYWCSLKIGLPSRWAITVVSILYFASPWLVYSHELWAMTFLGLLLIAALLGFLNQRYVVAALLLTVASMQSEAFVVMIGAWAVYLFFSKQKRAALKFGGTAAGALVVAGLLNLLLVGKVSLRGMWFVFNPALWKAFIESQRGLFPFVPWTVLACCAIVFHLLKRNRDSRVLTMLVGFLPVAGVYLFLPDTGGVCYGPRYWIPFLPWMAILVGWFLKNYWTTRRWILLPTAIVLIGLSAAFNITAAVMSPSQFKFWEEPPWYSSKLLLMDSDLVNADVTCPEYWLGSDCGPAVPTQVTTTVNTPVRTSSIVIISRLACATQIADGTPVGRLHIFDTLGERARLDILAGRDSSEWSYDCSATRWSVKHQRAEVFSSFEASLSGETCQGHCYLSKLSLNDPVNVSRIDFEWLGASGAICFRKVTLMDDKTGRSYTIETDLVQP